MTSVACGDVIVLSTPLSLANRSEVKMYLLDLPQGHSHADTKRVGLYAQ